METHLTIKHLAPYLPYGLKMKYESKSHESIKDLTCSSIEYMIATEHHGKFKPILRPLTDLTKEIEHNGEKFMPKNILTRDDLGGEMVFPINGIALFKVKSEYESVPLEVAMKVMDKMLEWHFDVFNLIDKGLAIDINTLEQDKN